MPITIQELKQAIARPNAKELIQQITKQNDGRGLFHDFLEEIESDELHAKLVYLFEKAKDLELDANQIWFHPRRANSPFAKWGNTPLHNGLAYENFQAIEWFLEEAHKNHIDINLHAKDSCGKTPLLLSIKVNAPFDLIVKLISDDNYQMADDNGMTPMMLACALRRLDVMQCLIERDAKVKGYAPIDFSAISEEQKVLMSDFINQIHAESGKSLGHFSVLRAGTIADQKGENLPQGDVLKIRLAKQGCVINLLKDAGMDGFRDESARWNCVTNEHREPCSIQGDLMKGGQLCFVSEHAKRDDGGRVYLNIKENINKCFSEYARILQEQAPVFFRHIRSQKFTGISLIESIMSRSESALTLLKDCGLNLEIQQQAGAKTVSGFIDGLKQNVANPKLISELDVKYLFILPDALLNPIPTPVAGFQSFGFFNDSEPVSDRPAVSQKSSS